MRLYWEVAKRSFRRYATYRAATAAGLFTNTIFGFLRAYVFIALFAVAGERIGRFDQTDTLTYVFVGQGILMTVSVWGWSEIADSIRSGAVVTDLFRPYDYQGYWLASDLGRGAYQLVARGIVPFVAGGIFFDLRLPADPGVWAAFLTSVALAVVVAFGIRFIQDLTVFWLLDNRGVTVVIGLMWWTLSGLTVPIDFFPEWLRRLASAAPFAATLQVPIDVFLGKYRGASLAPAFAFQAMWGLLLLIGGRALLGVATRRVVTQGG